MHLYDGNSEYARIVCPAFEAWLMRKVVKMVVVAIVGMRMWFTGARCVNDVINIDSLPEACLRSEQTDSESVAYLTLLTPKFRSTEFTLQF